MAKTGRMHINILFIIGLFGLVRCANSLYVVLIRSTIRSICLILTLSQTRLSLIYDCLTQKPHVKLKQKSDIDSFEISNVLILLCICLIEARRAVTCEIKVRIGKRCADLKRKYSKSWPIRPGSISLSVCEMERWR